MFSVSKKGINPFILTVMIKPNKDNKNKTIFNKNNWEKVVSEKSNLLIPFVSFSQLK